MNTNNTNYNTLMYGWADNEYPMYFHWVLSNNPNKVYGGKLGPSFSSDNGKWVHYEFDYSTSNKKLYCFRNGSIFLTVSLSYPIYQDKHKYIQVLTDDHYLYKQETRVSEFLVTQYCMHTSAFTPPTDYYMWPETHCLIDQNDIYGNK